MTTNTATVAPIASDIVYWAEKSSGGNVAFDDYAAETEAEIVAQFGSYTIDESTFIQIIHFLFDTTGGSNFGPDTWNFNGLRDILGLTPQTDAQFAAAWEVW